MTVDLEAISIDLSPIEGKVGQTITVSAIITNNGPDEIPKGEARAHITISSKWFILPRDISFKNLQGKFWKYVGTKRLDGKYEMYFQNDGGALPLAGGDFYGFVFNIKCRRLTPKGDHADITMSVGLNPNTATVGDVNPNNQFVSAEIIISKK